MALGDSHSIYASPGMWHMAYAYAWVSIRGTCSRPAHTPRDEAGQISIKKQESACINASSTSTSSHSSYMYVVIMMANFGRNLCQCNLATRYLANRRVSRSRRNDFNWDTPEMGSSFCSRARSFEASCHSRVSVLGGAGATKHVSPFHSVGGEERDAQRQRTASEIAPATPTRAIVERNTLRPWPGGLTGVRGPCGPNAT